MELSDASLGDSTRDNAVAFPNNISCREKLLRELNGCDEKSEESNDKSDNGRDVGHSLKLGEMIKPRQAP